MDRNKMLLAGAAIIVIGFIGYKMLSSVSYEPIVFMAEEYAHVDETEVNEVENHFFTPGGVAVPEAGRFIQISKYDHPGLTEGQVSRVQNQVIQSFGLRAVAGYEDRFFGVFRGNVPVYGYMGPDAFVLQVGPKESQADERQLLAAAADRIDELSEIPTDF